MFKIYKKFLKSTPEYLARYYWWAYLWDKSAWFFDHQPIINAILFGQYNNLMRQTMQELDQVDQSRVLQLTCVYGKLTPNIMQTIHPAPLHITDIAPIQLSLAQSKANPASQLLATRMNAEQLAYKNKTFSTIVLFFLLHEMPTQARKNTLFEAIRVLTDGGHLLITEYAELPDQHFLYRFFPIRWLTTKLEPFLHSFWHENLYTTLQILAKQQGKSIVQVNHTYIFSRFYRVTTYTIESLTTAATAIKSGEKWS